jgi:hypothetical protein
VRQRIAAFLFLGRIVFGVFLADGPVDVYSSYGNFEADVSIDD